MNSAAAVVQLPRRQQRTFGAVLQLPGYRVNVTAFREAAIKKELFSAERLAKTAGVATRQVWRLYAGEPVPYRSLVKLGSALGLKWPDEVLIPMESEQG